MSIVGEAWLELKPKISSSFAKDAQTGVANPLAAVAASAGKMLGVALIGAKLVGWLKDSSKAAIDNQHSLQIMSTTLTNLGLERSIEDVKKFTKHLSEERGVIEDVLQPAFTRLVGFTHDATKAMDLLSLAQNISAGTGKDLTGVAVALGKAAGGSTVGLMRLGVNIKDASGNILPFTELIKQLTKQYEGLGAKVADIDPFQKFNVAMHDIKVSVGDLLLPILRNQAKILKDDVLPPIKAIIGAITTVNNATGGWAVRGALLAVTLTSVAVVARKLILMFQGLNEVFRAGAIERKAAAAAEAAETGTTLGLVAAKEAEAVVTAKAALAEKLTALAHAEAAVAIGAEQIALDFEAAALGAVQLELVAMTPATEALALAQGEAAAAATALAVAETEAAAAAAAARGPFVAAAVAMGTALIPLAAGILAVVAGIKLWHFFFPTGRDASNDFTDAIEKQKLSTDDLVGSMQLWIDQQQKGTKAGILGTVNAKELSKVTKDLHKDFLDIVKDSPQYAQRFIDVVEKTSAGKEATKGWREELAKAKQATAAAIEVTRQYEDEVQSLTDATEALTSEEAIRLAQLHESVEASIKDREASKTAWDEEAKARQEAVAKLAALVGNESAVLVSRTAVDAAAIDVVTEHVQNLHDAISGAFSSYGDASSYFKNQLKVTGKDLLQFQRDTLADFQGWMSNIGRLMKAGVDQQIIDQLIRGGVEGNNVVLGYIDELSRYGIGAVNAMGDATDSMFALVIDAAGNVTRVLTEEAKYEFALEAWRNQMKIARANSEPGAPIPLPEMPKPPAPYKTTVRAPAPAAPSGGGGGGGGGARGPTDKELADEALRALVPSPTIPVDFEGPGSENAYINIGGTVYKKAEAEAYANKRAEINASVNIWGNVYGLDDLNKWADERDAALAAAIAGGQR